MPESRVCPKCNSPLPVNPPAGMCPNCLLKAGFPTEPVTAGFIPPDPSELAAHFPDFEIGELLGKGGMGAVYKAQQQRLDRVVAVKILPPEFSDDPAFAERFSREARTLAKLNHPNIVQVYDFGQAGPYFYFVMEYVDGVNVRQMIEAGDLQSQEALEIVPDICAALQFAHDAGVVHRDIKPENILIDQHGRVKIADFGLAMLLDREPADITLTGAHQVMGTPHYMAPEQLRGSHTIDHRADIYSLGVVFYELLTGELPIGRFERPSKKVEVDVRLDEVVLRTLENEPDRRYQHASDVKIDVESIVGESDTQLAPAKPVTADFESSVRSQLKVPAIGLLVAGIVDLLAMLVVLLTPIVLKVSGVFPEGLEGFIEGKGTFAEASFLSVIIALCSLASGIILVLGAARMFDLQSYPIALFAAMVAILPLAVGFPISLPFGIWALIVLLRRDVRTAFADWDADSEREQETKESASVIGITMSIGLVLGIVLGSAVDQDKTGEYMVFGIVIGLLVGCVTDAYNRRKSKD